MSDLRAYIDNILAATAESLANVAWQYEAFYQDTRPSLDKMQEMDLAQGESHLIAERAILTIDLLRERVLVVEAALEQKDQELGRLYRQIDSWKAESYKRGYRVGRGYLRDDREWELVQQIDALTAQVTKLTRSSKLVVEPSAKKRSKSR